MSSLNDAHYHTEVDGPPTLQAGTQAACVVCQLKAAVISETPEIETVNEAVNEAVMDPVKLAAKKPAKKRAKKPPAKTE